MLMRESGAVNDKAMKARTIRGKLVGRPEIRLGIVVARFNELITSQLLHGALDELAMLGVAVENCLVVYVPGSYEIPVAARKLAASGKFDGLICLGAVIRGATPHFDYVAGEAARGIGQVAVTFGLPVGFGVITTETMDQALERAGVKLGNKGAEAARAVLETIDCLAQLDNLG